jgi:hypothetical protein
VCHWDPLDPGGSTHLAASHTAPVAGKAVAMPLMGGSQECPGALGHGGRPSSCCCLLPLLGQTRGRTVDAASSASSMSARTWWPAELPLPSRASARLDMGKHGRRRLASSASLASARPWWLVELPRHLQGRHLEHDMGTYNRRSSAMRSAELLPSPASARPVSRTRGCLLLVGPSAARPAASSSSAGMDAWIHAQSCSMTLSEHRKLEEVLVVHVWPKAMCVHPQRSRLGTSSAQWDRLTRGPGSQTRAPRACSAATPQINFCIPLCSLCLFSDLFFPVVVSPLLVSSLINFHLSLCVSRDIEDKPGNRTKVVEK